MAETLDQLKNTLVNLTTTERWELAEFLLGSLAPDPEQVREAWRAEVSRRITRMRAGEVVGKPAEQLFAELRALYP